MLFYYLIYWYFFRTDVPLHALVRSSRVGVRQSNPVWRGHPYARADKPVDRHSCLHTDWWVSLFPRGLPNHQQRLLLDFGKVGATARLELKNVGPLALAGVRVLLLSRFEGSK